MTPQSQVRCIAFAMLLCVCPAIGMQSNIADNLLAQARQALTSEHKEHDKARRVLLEVVNQKGAAPETLVWAEIYLGYIEDRSKNRDAAIGWYQKAVAIEGASASAVNIARFGLRQPLTWIRHLDDPDAPKEANPAPKPSAPLSSTKRPNKPYVTNEIPTGLALAANLTERERRENFEALWAMIDFNYAHFALKSIDWNAIGHRYAALVSGVQTDDEFYRLMYRLVNELRDTHSWLNNYNPPPLADVAGVSIELFQGKPYVISGDKTGWEVVSVDDVAPAQKIEALRPLLRGLSSDRAFQRMATRFLLAGKENESTTVKLRSPSGQVDTVTWKRSGSASRRPAELPLPMFVTRQRFVHFGRYPSGLGYIQIESFNGRDDIDQEFDRAIETLRDTSALILDIRNNQGGFGHPKIEGRFFKKRTRFGYSYVKNGARHTDFDKREVFAQPAGKWQYTRPVALLVNDVTGSASDLFTTALRAAPQVVVIGSTTHGNLSGVGAYGVLPCGLVVRISNGYITDANNRAIEGNGNVPNIVVEPTVQDYLEHRDPVLQRAIDLLLKPGRSG